MIAAPTDTARRSRLAEPVGRATLLVGGAVAVIVFVLALTSRLGSTMAPSPASAVLEALAFAVLAGLGVPLIVVDVREHRLPNVLVGSAGAAGAVLLTASGLAGGAPLDSVRAVAGALALGGAYAIVALLRPGALGGGDVKLAAVIGVYLAWLGWDELLLGTASAFVAGGAHALVLLALGRVSASGRIPFGPAMLAGAAAAAVIGWA